MRISNRRSALGRILGSIGGLAAWTVARARIHQDEARPVAHRPDVRNFKPHKLGTRALAISPDGRLLATAGESGSPKVWDAASGRELFALQGHRARIFSVAFSPDSRLLVTTGEDSSDLIRDGIVVESRVTGHVAKIWDAATGREVAGLKSGDDFGPVAFGPGGLSLASLGRENLLQVWDLRDRKVIFSLKGMQPERNRHTLANRSVAFDAGARRVALSTIDLIGDEQRAILKLWDVAKERYREILPREQLGFGSAGRDCLLSPDGRVLVTTYYDLADPSRRSEAIAFPAKAALIDFDTGAVLRHTAAGLEDHRSLVAFSPDGKRFLSATEGGLLKLWDVETGRLARTIRGPEGVAVPKWPRRTIATRAVAFLPEGLRVASGGLNGWNEYDKDGRIIADPETGEDYRTDPLRIWEAEFDWHREGP